jgi:hypothetical protein
LGRRLTIEQLRELIPGAPEPLFGAVPDRPLERLRKADVVTSYKSTGRSPPTTLQGAPAPHGRLEPPRCMTGQQGRRETRSSVTKTASACSAAESSCPNDTNMVNRQALSKIKMSIALRRGDGWVLPNIEMLLLFQHFRLLGVHPRQHYAVALDHDRCVSHN